MDIYDNKCLNDSGEYISLIIKCKKEAIMLSENLSQNNPDVKELRGLMEKCHETQEAILELEKDLYLSKVLLKKIVEFEDFLGDNLPADLNPLINLESNITLEQAVLLALINKNPTKCGTYFRELLNTKGGYADTIEKDLYNIKDLKGKVIEYILQIHEAFHWFPILKKLSNFKKIWKYNNFYEARKQQMMDLYFKTYLLKSKIMDAKDLHDFYGIAKKMENCTVEFLKQSRICKDCSKCKFNPELNIN